MIRLSTLQVRRVSLALGLSLLCGGAGCDDGTVRGEGSIHIPADQLKASRVVSPSDLRKPSKVRSPR